jgi:serine/threonine-protein kinase RsbW
MEKFIKIGSSINNILELDDFLNTIFLTYNIDEKLYYNIYLSLSEAVNNAIQHGNKYDSNKFVKIYFSISSNYYEFIIEDEGQGFFIENVNDPTLLKNLRNESGRGIFIMKNYSDNFEILNNGNKVKLNFLIDRD